MKNTNWKNQIVTLCGSMKFATSMYDIYGWLSRQGAIVLMPNMSVSVDRLDDPEFVNALQRVHDAKIKVADVILIVDIGGYIGKDTQREMSFAEKLFKPIFKFSEIGNGIGGN